MTFEGMRIWLSASIPKDAARDEAELIRRFVRAFAAKVFEKGGCLVHGSHPSIRDELLMAAAEYKEERERKAGLVLVVSRYYSKEPVKNKIDLKAWNEVCQERVIETREALAKPTDADVARRKELEVPHKLEELTAPERTTPEPDVPKVSPDESLAILREALAEQSNAFVALGGKWGEDVVENIAGVPKEVELARARITCPSSC